MYEIRSSMPNLWIAATVSPPPAIENAFDAAIASPSSFVPPANASNSKTPTGPFQTMVPAFAMIVLSTATDVAPMSRMRSSASTSSTAFLLRGRSRREFLRADDVDGNRDLARKRVEDRARFADQVRLDERLADAAVGREDERVRDAPADDQHVDLGQERLQHGELGRDFRAADDRDERARGIGERLAERVELGSEQGTGARDRRMTRDPVRRRLGAMRGAERIVDVDVAERGHLSARARRRPSSRRD
jgi:hypothetical protein